MMPNEGRWCRPEETSTPTVAATTATRAISPRRGNAVRALDRSVVAWK